MNRFSILVLAATALTAGAALAQSAPQTPLPAHSSGSTGLQSPHADQGMPASGQFNPGGTANAPDPSTTNRTVTTDNNAANTDARRDRMDGYDGTAERRARTQRRAPRADRG